MTPDQFWAIIDRVHAANPRSMDAKCAGLEKELLKLDAAALKGFLERFDEAEDRAYDWKLWGAAYLINGGCSDDSFSDFRATLISMGRKTFESALADPDGLAGFEFGDDGSTYEGYQYVPHQVAENKLGGIPERHKPHPADPSGEDWDEDDLPRLLPKLAEKYDG